MGAKKPSDQQLWPMQKMKNLGSIGNSGRPSTEESEDDDISKLAISTFQAREEEIERKKMAVKEKVELQLGRAEEETRRLAQIWDVSSQKIKELSNSLKFQTISEFWSYAKKKGIIILNSKLKEVFICFYNTNY